MGIDELIESIERDIKQITAGTAFDKQSCYPKVFSNNAPVLPEAESKVSIQKAL